MSHTTDFEPAVHPRPSGAAATMLRCAARAALTAPAGPSPAYLDALSEARRAVGGLAVQLNRAVREFAPAERIPDAAQCFAAVIDDVPAARLLPEDEAELYEFIARFIDHATRSVTAAARQRAPGDTLPWRAAPVSSLERWRRGNQLYALANRSAAQHIRMASGALLAGPGIAAAALTGAAADVRALTAAMSYAAAMPVPRYASVVRPGAARPRLRFEPDGSMNLDHREYRAAMDELLSDLDLRTAELAAPVAAAFGLLLDADLHDLERRIGLTHRLVGSVAAHDHRPAVHALRLAYRRRVDAYLPFLCPAHG